MLQLRFKNKAIKPVWLVDNLYSVGKGASCKISVNDKHLEQHHANIKVENDVATLVNVVGDKMVRVNGVPVTDERTIIHGDIINLGFTEARLIDTRRQKDQPLAQTAEILSVDPWVLIPQEGAASAKEFEINGATVLGRGQGCDIRLNIAHLSRRHAKLSVGPRGLEIEDLESANGTFVNGQRIAKAVLKPGDHVRFDTVTFNVSGPQPDLASTTVRPIIQESKVRQSASASASAIRKPSSATPVPGHIRGVEPQNSSSPAASSVADEPPSSRSSLLQVGLMVLLAAAAGVWYWLLR